MRKTPEEKAAARDAMLERSQARADRWRQRAEDAKTVAAAPEQEPEPMDPVEKARLGRAAGLRYLQVELPHSQISGFASAAFARGLTQQSISIADHGDLLGEIEDEGWRLEHAQWLYVETGQNSRDKFLQSGQQIVTNGEILGIFLFRSAD